MVMKYRSHYSDSMVNAAQYITEIMCENMARAECNELPPYYWRLDKWRKVYAKIIPCIYKLLKKYNEVGVIQAAKRGHTQPFNKRFLYDCAKYNEVVVKEEVVSKGMSGKTREQRKDNIISRVSNIQKKYECDVSKIQREREC